MIELAGPWRSVVLGLALVAMSCGRSRNDAPPPEGAAGLAAGRQDAGARRAAAADTLEASQLVIDAAAAPRHDQGTVTVIAGEPVRIGLRLTGGTPPYDVSLTAEPQGRPTQPGEVSPLQAELRPELASSAADTATGPGARPRALDMAVQATLDARARSGIYRVHATVRDAAGKQAVAVSEDMALIGSDAPVLPAPAGPRFVEILDVADRRRRAFVRGERVTIHARLPGGGHAATLAIVDPDGAMLLRAPDRPLSGSGELREPLDIPRLARPGAYRVQVTDEHGAAAASVLHVAGAPYAPVTRLTMDALAIYGGPDGRAPRAARLHRGERVIIEARVGGGQRLITGIVRLHAADGTRLVESELARAEIALPAPDARVFLAGPWQVPATIPPGRYQLQLEAVEGDHVSARYREILID